MGNTYRNEPNQPYDVHHNTKEKKEQFRLEKGDIERPISNTYRNVPKQPYDVHDNIKEKREQFLIEKDNMEIPISNTYRSIPQPPYDVPYDNLLNTKEIKIKDQFSLEKDNM